MGLQKITNLVDKAQDRLIEQDKQRITTLSVVDAFVDEIQTVENSIFDVYTKRGMDTAIGAQLDVIGIIVGESRVGRSDDIYRIAIKARIKLNTGSGEPNTIIDAMKQFMNTDIVDFSEPYPAYFTLFIQTNINISNIASIVREISPTGVGSSVSTLPIGLIPFTLGTVRGEPADFEVQSLPLPSALNDYAISAIDTLQIEAMQVYSFNPNAGLGTVYLTKSSLVLDDIGTEYDIGNGDTLELKLINANEDYTTSIFGGRLATVKI